MWACVAYKGNSDEFYPLGYVRAATEREATGLADKKWPIWAGFIEVHEWDGVL